MREIGRIREDSRASRILLVFASMLDWRAVPSSPSTLGHARSPLHHIPRLARLATNARIYAPQNSASLSNSVLHAANVCGRSSASFRLLDPSSSASCAALHAGGRLMSPPPSLSLSLPPPPFFFFFFFLADGETKVLFYRGRSYCIAHACAQPLETDKVLHREEIDAGPPRACSTRFRREPIPMMMMMMTMTMR